MTMTALPQRAPGLRLLGEYAGSGYQQPRYLVARADGQTVQVTRLLYEVLDSLDGCRDDIAAAAEVSARIDRQLTVDGLRFLVDVKLRPLGLIADPDAAGPGSPPRADPVLRVRLHATLIPAGYTYRFGRILAPLFAPVVIGICALALITADVWLAGHASLPAAIEKLIVAPGLLLAATGIMVVAALFHELGHAAGCVRSGGVPGAIGVGLYVIFPAFYTDVTDAYRLSRSGRLRTDLGGVYFSGIAAVAACGGYLATGSAVLLLVGVLTQLELAQQLLPLVRLDGYYILGDLSGIPDLFGKVKPLVLSVLRRRPVPDSERMRPHTRTIVTVWVCLVVPVLSAGTVLLLFQLPTIVSATWSSWQGQWHLAHHGWETGSVVGVTTAVLAAALSSIPALGLTLLVVVLVRKLLRAMMSRLPGRPPGAVTPEFPERGAAASTERAVLQLRPTERRNGWQRAAITRYADIRAHTSQADTRLEVVGSDDDPRICAAFSAADYHAIIDVLDRHYTLMLIDTGTGILDDAIQGLLDRADQLVVVMSPALDGTRVTAGTLDWLAAHNHADLAATAVAVIKGIRDDRGLVDLGRVGDQFTIAPRTLVQPDGAAPGPAAGVIGSVDALSRRGPAA